MHRRTTWTQEVVMEIVRKKECAWQTRAGNLAIDCSPKSIFFFFYQESNFYLFCFLPFFLYFKYLDNSTCIFFFNKLVFMSLFQISKDYTHVKLLTSFSCDNRLLRPMPLLYNNAISYKPNRMKGTCNNRTYMKYWLRENTLNVHTHPNLFIMTFFISVRKEIVALYTRKLWIR